MGANQSNNADAQNGASSALDSVSKTCYYELLGVDRNATEDDIKKAYRRKALEAHPDRNYGDVERATQLFAEVQAAYEVLSDPQERAWYDSHRDAILRGADANSGEHYEHSVRVTTAGDILSMFGTFNRVQYSDSPSGFFTVLRDAFATLAREEDIACEMEDLEPVDYPSFGHKNDSFEDVVRPFYAAWNGFATKKTFTWKDIYRYSEAADRRVRRMMEKENKRLREEGIREFNDAVRSLVAFARKRDPRYIANTQSEAERQKILRDAATAQAARSRAANQAKFAQHVGPDWTTIRDNSDADFANEDENSSAEEEVQQYECVACDKTFKSEKQYEAHERSKKHIKVVQQLKRQMLKQGKILHLDEDASTPSVAPDASDHVEEGISIRASSEEAPQAQLSSKTEQANQPLHEPNGHVDPTIDEMGLDEGKGSPSLSRSEDFESGDEYAPRHDVENRILGLDLESSLNTSSGTITENAGDDTRTSSADGNAPTAPKQGKAKEKRAKKAAQQLQQQTAAVQAGKQHRCAACGENFPSKTKLFNHIKELDHAQAVPNSAGRGKKGKR